MRLHRDTQLDPILVTAMQHLFQWANEEGLKGQKVSALTIKKFMEDCDPFDPIGNTVMVNCLVWIKDQAEEESQEL